MSRVAEGSVTSYVCFRERRMPHFITGRECLVQVSACRCTQRREESSDRCRVFNSCLLMLMV